MKSRTLLKCIITAALCFLFTPELSACTGIAADTQQGPLFGSNEDWTNPYAYIQITPASQGKYGTLFFDFKTGGPPFSGMNDQGLAFDMFGVPKKRVKRDPEKPNAARGLISRVMQECASVDEAVQLVQQFNLTFLARVQLMFADKSGHAVIIESNNIIHRKKDAPLIITNFRQSDPEPETYPCERYATAENMLNKNAPTLELMKHILYATRLQHPVTTQYSTIYDLQRGIVHVYLFQDFDTEVALNLTEELAKGKRTIELASLFPENKKRTEYIQSYLKHSNNPFLSPVKTAFIYFCGALFVCMIPVSLSLKKPVFTAAWTIGSITAALQALSILIISKWQILFVWGLPSPKLSMATPAEKVLFSAPWLALILTIVTCACAIQSWRKRYWNTRRRIFYSLVAVCALSFVIFLQYHLARHPL